uniref:FISUMP domain-containing protein n=1 Tax=Fibrobacter sp. UBA2449 TaxID=1946529 RepID=UPI0025C050CB
SSAPVEDLSSSSSVKSSSSIASSSSAKSSSSFLRKDYTSANHSYSELEDPRDHRVYKYLTIRGENKNGERDSVTVMAENLNVGIMVQGAEDQTDETKIEKYCYDNDTLNCYQYGGLYQWAEAMQLPSECNAKSCADQIKPNHRGICPEGWRLLTYDDFYIVVHADGNDAGVKGVRAMGFGGHNYSGYSLIGAGYNWGYKFRNLNETTYWFYPEEGSLDKPAALSGSQSKSSTGNASQSVYKTHGMSIRCVMAE